MGYRILNGDVDSFSRHYHGPRFHALLCDAPYHLYSIVKRFGGENAAPAQGGVYSRASAGFMGKTWDGGDIAMNPATWAGLAQHLLPGAFLFVFAGMLNDDLISVAMREAGLVKFHRMIHWSFASGFPKATRLDNQIDAGAGAEQNIIGTRRADDITGGNYYKGKGNPTTINLTAPATPLARAWANHRYGLQALKPAAESVLIFRKPYQGRPIDSIVEHGAGAMNIGAGKIGVDPIKINRWDDSMHPFGNGAGNPYTQSESLGRWPANLALSHSPDCEYVETIREAAPFDYPDGVRPTRSKQIWRCVPGCPVAELDEQSGELQQSYRNGNRNSYQQGSTKFFGPRGIGRDSFQEGYLDSGGAFRFFFNADYAAERIEQAAGVYYQAKAGRGERDAGLENMSHKDKSESWNESTDLADRMHGKTEYRNPHPTVKPIALARWLASLLLPPDSYSPRRLLIPFAGVGSEMIGALLAGWEEVVGVELEREYVDIARARLAWWTCQPKDVFDSEGEGNELQKHQLSFV